MIFLLQTVSVPCQLFSPRGEKTQMEQREELDGDSFMAAVLF